MDVIKHDDGSPTALGATLDKVDTFFTIAFAVELSMNMFCHWLRPFLHDGRPPESEERKGERGEEGRARRGRQSEERKAEGGE
jgi:hypothetical protein